MKMILARVVLCQCIVFLPMRAIQFNFSVVQPLVNMALDRVSAQGLIDLLNRPETDKPAILSSLLKFVLVGQPAEGSAEFFRLLATLVQLGMGNDRDTREAVLKLFMFYSVDDLRPWDHGIIIVAYHQLEDDEPCVGHLDALALLRRFFQNSGQLHEQGKIWAVEAMRACCKVLTTEFEALQWRGPRVCAFLTELLDALAQDRSRWEGLVDDLVATAGQCALRWPNNPYVVAMCHIIQQLCQQV